MSGIQTQHDKIDQLVQSMAMEPESLDAAQIREIAGVLLDLNAYARQMDEELTKAHAQISILRNQQAFMPSPEFSLN